MFATGLTGLPTRGHTAIKANFGSDSRTVETSCIQGSRLEVGTVMATKRAIENRKRVPATSKRVSQRVDVETLAEEAFARRRAECLALPEAEVMGANLDVGSAVARVLGAIPKLNAVREELAAHLRKFDPGCVSRLEDYAWALHHAQGAYLIALKPVYCSAEKLREARALRMFLLRQLQALAARDLVSEERWKGLHRGQGRTNLATDLNILSQVHVYYSKHGSERDGAPIKSGLASAADVARALELSRLVLAAFGRRKLTPEIAAAEDVRDRAFTLMARAYDEAQRCLTYLWWHEEEGRELPSLWKQQHRRKRIMGQAEPANAVEGQVAESIPATAAAPDRALSATPPALSSNSVPRSDGAARPIEEQPFIGD